MARRWFPNPVADLVRADFGSIRGADIWVWPEVERWISRRPVTRRLQAAAHTSDATPG